jgi:hypothetical protein
MNQTIAERIAEASREQLEEALKVAVPILERVKVDDKYFHPACICEECDAKRALEKRAAILNGKERG